MRPRSVLAALGTALVLVTAGACGSGTPVGGSPVVTGAPPTVASSTT